MAHDRRKGVMANVTTPFFIIPASCLFSLACNTKAVYFCYENTVSMYVFAFFEINSNIFCTRCKKY